MKKIFSSAFLCAVVLTLFGCSQANDSGGGDKVYVRPADETVFVGAEDTEDTVPLQMIGIKGGNFIMGNTDTSFRSGDERPVRKVTLNSFMLSSTEITEAQWEAVMTVWPVTDPQNGDKHPAMYISWYDAIKFCNQLSLNKRLEPVYYIGESYPTISYITKDTRLQEENDDGLASPQIKADFTKNGYRLPTEAEWEFAAGGAQEKPTIWSGTSTISNIGDYVVYDYDGPHIDPLKPSEVQEGRKPVSDIYALYDMSGNVYEWCYDWYDEYYYSAKNNTENPVGPTSGLKRVVRGGSWTNDLAYVRVAERTSLKPTSRFLEQGFRIARSVE